LKIKVKEERILTLVVHEVEKIHQTKLLEELVQSVLSNNEFGLDESIGPALKAHIE